MKPPITVLRLTPELKAKHGPLLRAWGPRLEAELRAGRVVEVAGFRLVLDGAEAQQQLLELEG